MCDHVIEILNLSIALRMSRGCFRVLDIQDGEEFSRQLVDEFLAAIRLDLCWWSESINPAIQDHLRQPS